MTPQLRPAKNGTPHPLVTIAGLLITLALAVIALRTTLLPRTTAIILALAFLILFRWASRWSAKAMSERRQRELEELKHTPVLGLRE
jgi:Flp pilus assembly protein TadB